MTIASTSITVSTAVQTIFGPATTWANSENVSVSLPPELFLVNTGATPVWIGGPNLTTANPPAGLPLSSAGASVATPNNISIVVTPGDLITAVCTAGTNVLNMLITGQNIA